VIYLNPSKSPLVFETEFKHGELTHKYNVIRIWEQPTEKLQQYEGLLPFAVLSATNSPEIVLKEVLNK
jgi:predicted transposase YdaD